MSYECKFGGAARTTPFYRFSAALGVTLLLMAPATETIAQSPAQHCTVRYSDATENTSPTGTTFVAVTPFALSCRGGISASLDVISGGIADTQLQIEKRINGTWSVRERGHHISHKAEPGTYRLTVVQTARPGSFISWRLRYSKPLP